MSQTPKHIKAEIIKLADEVEFPMYHIQGGSFGMGDNENSPDQSIHQVNISDFYLAPYPLTQQLYEAVMGKNPSHFKGENRPVENVNWHDAQQFCEKLSKETGKDFRLPTEAEWEYAARGGIHSTGYEYSGSDKLKQVGWYGDNSGDEIKPVGLLLPNELGLYDMSGNVWEWCEDWYGRDYYKNSPKDNPGGPDMGDYRVVRGGYYSNSSDYCCVTYRGGDHPGNCDDYISFRLALSLPV